MKEYSTAEIRNVVLVSHGGNGKTSLCEAMLFDSGAITRLGRVEEGNTTSDYDPDEIKRKSSVNLSIVPVEWKGTKVNLLDTPGYADFVGEQKAGIRAADGALLLTDATAGVQVGTEQAWAYLNERGLPRLVVVNRMDRENANFDQVVAAVRGQFGKHCAPLLVPIGAQDAFRGVIDLVHMKAFVGEQGREEPIPSELRDQVAAYREQLVEAVAETDDDLTLKYLEGEEITEAELQEGLRAGVCRGAVVPIVACSAAKNIGVTALLDAICAYLPSPLDAPRERAMSLGNGEEIEINPTPSEPLAALVFKTSADPYVGKLTYFRVYAGVMKSDSHVLNATKKKDERIGQIFYLRGKQQENTRQVVAGDIGAVAKLVHNCAGYVIQCALAEVFTLGVKAGVDPLALFKAVRNGAVGRRRTFDGLIEQFLPGKFEPPSFTLRLAHKDVSLATALARELCVPMRMADLALEELTEALNRGWGERDSRVAMLLQEERAGVEIRVPEERLRELER